MRLLKVNHHGTRWLWPIAVVLGVACMLVAPGASSAAVAARPHWALISQAAPSYFHAGDTDDFYEIVAVNDGGAATSGEITVTDTLPAGVTATEVVGGAEETNTVIRAGKGIEMVCSTAGQTVTCTTAVGVPVGYKITVKIDVDVAAEAAGSLINEVTVAGGEAESRSFSNETPVTSASQAVPYGAEVASDITSAGGSLDEQAGSHPFSFTTLLAFSVGSVDTSEHCLEAIGCAQPVADAKNIEVKLPPGLVGNPTAVPACTQAEFATREGSETCPADTQVGDVFLYFFGKQKDQYAPVYNVEPPPGQPAELSFSVSTSAHIPIFFHVRSDGDYGLTADVSEISEADEVRMAALTIWGVPANEAFNSSRDSEDEDCTEGCASTASEKPFLRMPTSCTGAGELLSLPLAGDSWQEELASPYPTLATGSLSPTTDCEALTFNPSAEVQPTTTQAASPAGYDVKLTVPQNEEPEGLATPDVDDVEVALPEGTVISPSGANGLVACNEEHFGRLVEAAGKCPEESKIGDVSITTPLLSAPLTGSLYVAEPECSPCTEAQAETGELVRLYLEAEGSGVRIKLEGHTKINQKTGQLTAVFTDNPQLPFSELTVALEDGADAPLANSSTCGSTHASANLTPWSSSTPTSIAAPAFSVSGCTTPGFTPSFEAGMTASTQGGAYSPFSVTFRRQGQEQDLSGITVNAPKGLLGDVSHVPLCAEAQANAGTCSADSLIGEASAEVGPGENPYPIKGGRVYLTEKYGGGSFGLSIVVPAEAGPFRLAGNAGNGTEVIRAAIDVNPVTAAISITSNPLPQELDGIPLQIQAVNVTVNRPEFMFNATNCEAQSVTGTITGAQSASAAVSSPYQPKGCANLGFKPSFTASTRAKTSKLEGASLTVKIKYPSGAYANVRRVHVELPKALPVREVALKKACLEAKFAANPASCKESIVGSAEAVTPLLSEPLRGPAYFVSHGGKKFPELVLVLQGEGVTIDLYGETFVSTKGILSNTFNAVPDAPISSFELKLPEGEDAALAAPGGKLCAKQLPMPTVLDGQNGKVIEQKTKIAVGGCSKHIVVSSHTVAKRTLTLKLVVPAAGKLTASGKGLKSTTKKASDRRVVTLKLAQKRAGKLTTKVKLIFKPKKGKKQSKSVKVKFKK